MCVPMKKKKIPKPKIPADEMDISPDVLADIKLGQKSEYQQYLKDQARRLRDLERIASGRNTYEPW